MQWTQENTLYFIELVKKRPVIWDETLRFNSSSERRESKLYAQMEIGNILGMAKEEVSYKWMGIKGQYSREKKRQATGYHTRWFAYQPLSTFLDKNDHDESPTAHTYEYNMTSPNTPTSSVPMACSIKRRCSTPSLPATPPPTKSSPSPSKTPSPLPKIRISEPLTINRQFADQTSDTPVPEDDITAYALYVAAQIRKLQPVLQCKVKLEIQTLLCRYELQNIDETTPRTSS